MYRIESQIDPESAEFFEYKQHYLELLKVYRERIMEVRKGGSPSSVEQHKKRVKLLVRERIALLIDPNTPFFDLSSLADWGAFEA